MAEIHHKKQQITAALTDLRIQMQNEIARLRRTPRYETNHSASDQKSSMEMGQLRCPFRVASVALTPAERENLYSQLESRAG